MTLLRRYRIVLLALLASAVLHAAVMIGVPQRMELADSQADAQYSATLEAPESPPVATPAPEAPAPRPAPRRSTPRAKPRPLHEIATIEPLEPVAPLASADVPAIEAMEEPRFAPEPEVVALAAPAAEAAREPEPFPVDAIPADLAIDYRLTSAFAEGRAEYRWKRDGDSYRITGSAEAEGFFALFLEGQIVQESRGTITAGGLRPESFSEHKPGSPAEGLEFDWRAKTVVFDRNGSRKTSALEDNTVDWLSMIFQLAHRPPQGDSVAMKVFTQRKMYAFKLQVLGTETLEIPLGRVRALHLRHVDPDDNSEVDVWLGVDQYYMPVKMRYPVAKNRLTVEQVATRLSGR
jgi:hypothetical protein